MLKGHIGDLDLVDCAQAVADAGSSPGAIRPTPSSQTNRGSNTVRAKVKKETDGRGRLKESGEMEGRARGRDSTARDMVSKVRGMEIYLTLRST